MARWCQASEALLYWVRHVQLTSLRGVLVTSSAGVAAASWRRSVAQAACNQRSAFSVWHTQ